MANTFIGLNRFFGPNQPHDQPWLARAVYTNLIDTIKIMQQLGYDDKAVRKALHNFEKQEQYRKVVQDGAMFKGVMKK